MPPARCASRRTWWRSAAGWDCACGWPNTRPTTQSGAPIEHRLFSQVERSLSGIILDSPQTALQASARTGTQSGLTVTARILDGIYELGRKCSDTFHTVKDTFIHRDAVLGKWNSVVDANGFS